VARLVCPFCGTVVVEDGEPAPGACPGCGALYAGGGETPPGAVAAALAHWGIDGLPADVLAQRLFEVDPAAAPAPGAAITSDQRDGFYLWWVFVRPGGAGPGRVFEGLLAR
jgi:hypothetical protein